MVLSNIHRRPHSRLRQPGDFFASLSAAEQAVSIPHEQSAEQQFAIFKMIFGDRIKVKK